MLNEQQAKRSNLALDLISFGSVCLLALNQRNEADPGEFIFLFVFENLLMVLAFTVFFLFFNPAHQYYLKKKGVIPEKAGKTQSGSLFSLVIYTLTGFVILAFIVFIAIIFLNQLTVELLLAFLKDNAYRFESLEILSAGMFFERPVLGAMQEFFGKNYLLFFWIFSLKHFISLVLHFFGHPDLKTKSFPALAGISTITAQILISPVSMLLACIMLVILSGIYGAQTWIILVTLAVFRLLFLLLSNRLAHFFKTL